MPLSSVIACHECDLLQSLPSVSGNVTLKCRRCGAVLCRKRENSLERTLALTLAGLMLFLLANAFPFLSFKMESQVRETTLITGITELYAQGLEGLALLVFLTTIAVPFLQMSGMLWVLLPLKFGMEAPKMMYVFRFVRGMQPWGMMEVFMLGILVSVVKLSKMAQIVPGIAIFAFLLLIFVQAAASSSLDPHIIWERWEKRA
ncbi:MAG: paraquat-inducible protein A [Desulfococcaceae bacterium]